MRDNAQKESGAPAFQHEYLLIEADPIASSSRQIEHARYICEKLRHDYSVGFQEALKREYKGGATAAQTQAFIERTHSVKKHVIFVVHLSRNRFDLSSFLLDFD